MSNFPRRSPRFQSQEQNSHPSFGSTPSFSSYSSQTSSVSSTSHPSPSNDSLSLTNQPQQYPLQIQSHFLAPSQAFSVPLPSPSANESNPFAHPQYQTQNMSGQGQNQKTSSHQNNSTQNQGLGGQRTLQHTNSFSQPQQRDYAPKSVNGVPPGLPADFLAEAAKRAQMACLMRDMGDVSL